MRRLLEKFLMEARRQSLRDPTGETHLLVSALLAFQKGLKK